MIRFEVVSSTIEQDPMWSVRIDDENTTTKFTTRKSNIQALSVLMLNSLNIEVVITEKEPK